MDQELRREARLLMIDFDALKSGGSSRLAVVISPDDVFKYTSLYKDILEVK